MRCIEALLLTCLFLCGGYGTYSDIKKGIIPNRLIVIGLIAGTILHVIMLFLGGAPYYPTWLMNMAIADILAFCLFWGKLWAAGDSKLFMLLYFLFPPMLLDHGSLSYCIVPYIFIFVPALLWMIIDSTIRLIRKEPRKHNRINIGKIVIHCFFVIIETTAFATLLLIVFPVFIQEQPMFFSAFILLYAYICGINDWMKKWYILALHILILLVAAILNAWAFTLPSWENYLFMALALFIQWYCSLYNYQLIKTSSIRKGMIPAAETVISFQVSKVHSLPQDPSEEITARITEEEAAAIRRWESSAKGKPEIWIVRKVPFAIMITIGFIIWVIVRNVWR